MLDDYDKFDLHLIPQGDSKLHTANHDCFCKPIQDEEYPNVWTHNKADHD